MPRLGLLVPPLAALHLRWVSSFFSPYCSDCLLQGRLFVPQLLSQSLLSLLRPSLPPLFCLFLLSPPLPPFLLKKVLYDLFFESFEPLEGGSFLMGSPIPLPSPPGSLNPFFVLPEGSFNLFKEWVQEFSPTEGLVKMELFICKQIKELTTRNLLLAMQVNELKKQLECAGCLPKWLCRDSA